MHVKIGKYGTPYDVLSFEVPDEEVHAEIIQWLRSCLADRLTELK